MITMDKIHLETNISQICIVKQNKMVDDDDEIVEFLSELDRRCSISNSRKNSTDDRHLSPVPHIHLTSRSPSPQTLLSPISAGIELDCHLVNRSTDVSHTGLLSPSRFRITPPCSPSFKVPRDRQQPARGSICSLTNPQDSASGSEEEDTVSAHIAIRRPCSKISPDIKTLRKRRIQNMNHRPPTPPVKSLVCFEYTEDNS